MRFFGRRKTNEERWLPLLRSAEEHKKQEALQKLEELFYLEFIEEVYSKYAEEKNIPPTINAAFARAFENYSGDLSEVIGRVTGQGRATLKSVFERYYFDQEILTLLRHPDTSLVDVAEDYLVRRFDQLYEVDKFRESLERERLEEEFNDVFYSAFFTFLKKVTLSEDEGGFKGDSTLKQFFLGIFHNKQLTFSKTKPTKRKIRDINKPADQEEDVRKFLADYQDEGSEEVDPLSEKSFVELVASFAEDQLVKAVNALSERCRKIIKLRVLLEYKHVEIARELNISHDAARMAYANCLKDLKRIYLSSKNNP